MSWKKVKLGQVLTHRKGSISIVDNENYKLCRVRLHRKGVLLREIKSGSSIKTKKQQLCKADDFIVAEMDAKVGGYGFIPKELDGAIVSSHYYLFEVNENLLKPDFLAVLNKTETLQNQIKAVGSTNYARVSPSDVLAWEIPLPSIQDQERIAEKLKIFETNKDHISTELDRQLGLVKELRQAYLREAMQGKLVPQDPADEPAEILLEKIKAEKENLVAEKRIKPDKVFPPIDPEEYPFEIPSNWTWCRLGEIFKFIDYRGKTPTKSLSGVRLITAKNIRMGYIDENPIEYMTESDYEKWMVRGFPRIGDLLFVTEGHTMGFVAQIDKTYRFALAQRTITLQPFSYDYVKFIYYFILCPMFQSTIKANATGSAAMGMQSAKLKLIPIPLPSLAEQERIVAKLEKLMKFCDELEANIKQGITNADRLLQTALHEALQI